MKLQDEKFIEHPIDDNCKMLYSFTLTGDDYMDNSEYKDDVVRRFMTLLKTGIYANEIEMIQPEIDNENDRIVKLNITVINGNVSKNLIREAINKG